MRQTMRRSRRRVRQRDKQKIRQKYSRQAGQRDRRKDSQRSGGRAGRKAGRQVRGSSGAERQRGRSGRRTGVRRVRGRGRRAPSSGRAAAGGLFGQRGRPGGDALCGAGPARARCGQRPAGGFLRAARRGPAGCQRTERGGPSLLCPPGLQGRGPLPAGRRGLAVPAPASASQGVSGDVTGHVSGTAAVRRPGAVSPVVRDPRRRHRTCRTAGQARRDGRAFIAGAGPSAKIRKTRAPRCLRAASGLSGSDRPHAHAPWSLRATSGSGGDGIAEKGNAGGDPAFWHCPGEGDAVSLGRRSKPRGGVRGGRSTGAPRRGRRRLASGTCRHSPRQGPGSRTGRAPDRYPDRKR